MVAVKPYYSVLDPCMGSGTTLYAAQRCAQEVLAL